MKCQSTIHGFVRDTLWKNIVYGMAFVLFSLWISSSFAQTTQQVKVEFNHKLTGFFLEGAHGKTACESCHVQGLFRGTPRDCASCHRSGDRASGKPSNHIPTTAACDTCHVNSSWTPSSFRHRADQGIVQGGCASCHNGSFSPGKPLTHISTTASCDSCHKTNAWQPASYSHAGVTPGSCASCHNGVKAAGKSVSHIPTTASCDACHSSSVPFAPISVTVTAMHAAMSGPPAAGNCASCHGGGFVSQNAQAKPATHISTSAQCDTCHSSKSSWATSVKPDHLAITPSVFGRCADCHNSVAALGKPGNHIPTNKQCDSCHTSGFSSWTSPKMNHAGTAGTCSTCHSGAYVAQNAQTKSAKHITTTAQCDTCHTSTTTWSGAAFNHTTATPAVAGRCSSCHNGTNALGKPTNHIPTGAQCDTCHKAFTTFAPASMNHSGTTSPNAVGNCITCHSGSYVAINAQSKPATHVPTTQSCDTCHTTVAWKPTTFTHQGVSAGTCATCHNGGSAIGKPVSHIPTTTSCDSCHTNYAAFSPAKMNHTGTTGPLSKGNCSTCHSGSYVSINAQSKPATHVITTAQCDTCHQSTSSWGSATYIHDANAVGKCSSCHNGATALGKSANHIPTSAQCSTCHNNYVTFRPALMNHVATTGPVATGNCSTCHNSSYAAINALPKPNAHIPTNSQCDTCHKSGYVAWTPSTMNHSGLAGQCSTCHNGSYLAQNAQTKPVNHTPTTAQCDTCHNSTTTWTSATFNHATATPPVTGRCSSCHNGSIGTGKPASHIPTSSQCDTCHKTFTNFASAVMSHQGTTGPVAKANCATCHNGAYLSSNAQAKTPNHLATTQNCDVCHSTSAWKPATFSHSGVVPGSCTTCHNGVTASGKSSPHIPTAQSCDVCHKVGLAWLPLITPYSHIGVPATGCVSCHTNAYPNIDFKPANHLPTSAACESCHHSFTSWLPTTFNHAGVASGTCQTCHGGTYTDIAIKPANHIPTTMPSGMPGNECSLCHNSTNSFGVEKMNHGSMQTGCITCHDSSSQYSGRMTKEARTANHHGVNAVGKDCSSSGCHKPLGKKGSTYINWD